MMKKFLLCAMILIFVVLVGCTNQTATEGPKLISPQVAQIDTAVIVRGNHFVLQQRAGVTRYLSVPLYFNTLSVFDQFHVYPGDYVTEGQLLATLNTEVIEERIENQLITVSNMRRDHRLANDIRQLEIDIMIMEQTQRVNPAAYNLDQAAAEAIELEWQNIERAQLQLRHQQDRQSFQLRQAEARLADLRAQQQNAELRAPFDGRITNVGNVWAGQTVAAMQPIIFIADGTEVVIEAIEFFTGNWPGSTHHLTGGPIGGRGMIHMAVKSYALIDGERFEIEYLEIPFEDRDFRPVRFSVTGGTPRAGRYAALHFYSQFIEDVLLVPENALFFGGTYHFVYRVVDGQLIYTEVRLQQLTPEVGIIEAGLYEGDVVFVRP